MTTDQDETAAPAPETDDDAETTTPADGIPPTDPLANWREDDRPAETTTGLTRDSIPALGEIGDAADTAIRMIASSAEGTIGPAGFWAFRDRVRDALAKLEQLAGVVPAAPAGWTLETAPKDSRMLATWKGVEGEWVAIGNGRWCLLPPHPQAAEGVVRHISLLKQWHARLTLVPVDAGTAPAATVESEADAEPAPERESSLVDVDPDSPAGKVAAELAELLGGHLSRPGLSAFAVSRHSGDLGACVPLLGDEVGHLRAVAGLLPDGQVDARIYGDYLHLAVVVARDGIIARISSVLRLERYPEQVAAALAWLAEIGVEVDGATA